MDYSKIITAEMKAEQAVANIASNRLAAYRAESDPLKAEAEYDAMLNGTEPDYTLWMAKVEEIKLRFPFPEAN